MCFFGPGNTHTDDSPTMHLAEMPLAKSLSQDSHSLRDRPEASQEALFSVLASSADIELDLDTFIFISSHDQLPLCIMNLPSVR